MKTPSKMYGALYLFFAFSGHLVVGLLGAFGTYPPGPNLIAWFLLAHPYPALHFLGSCVLGLSCSVSEMSYGFNVNDFAPGQFARSSFILSIYGLVGMVGTYFAKSNLT
jgi:hypothetical protein